MVNSANDLEGSLMMANHLRTFRAQLAMDIAIRTRAVGQRRVLRTTYFAVSQASKFELENDLFAVSVNRIAKRHLGMVVSEIENATGNRRIVFFQCNDH